MLAGPRNWALLCCACCVLLMSGDGVRAEPPNPGPPNAAPPNAAPPNAAPPSSAQLLLRGDELVSAKKYREALVAYKQAYELILPRMRQREFLREVAPRIMKRPELQQYMAREFAKQMTESDLKFMDRTVKLFGFAPDDLDLTEMMIALFTEQVAGFYNSETKEMFLIIEEPKAKPGFLDRLLGKPEFDAEEQKITLSHEMAHAPADQHFNLQGIDAAMDDNEDAALAVSALVEGEATLLMLGEMTRGDEADPSVMLQMQPVVVDRMFKLMNLANSIGGGRAMRAAPPFFKQSLIFPYHQGTVFVAHLTNQGGWKRVDRAFQFPPVSTEQILHPEKYLSPDQLDLPTSIELPDFKSILPGWKLLGQDTLGEYQTRLLLQSEHDGKRASVGWDGDRYAVLEKDGQPLLAWITTWDSEQDASEFISCLSRQSQHRLRIDRQSPLPKLSSDTASPRQITGGKRSHWSSRRGTQVALVEGLREGLDDQLAKSLLNHLLEAKRTEFQYRLPPLEEE